MNYKKFFFAMTLIILGILFRTIWHLGPNVEFVTAAALLAGSYLGIKWAVIIPLTILAVSDIFFIGNTNIFIFTWSGYALIGMGGHLISSKFKVQSSKIRIVRSEGLGIIASLWFYLWTNFGVWLLDSWGMYPKTISGLIDCYILALPFLEYNLIGNIILVPMSFLVVEIARFYIEKFGIRISKSYIEVGS